MDILCASTVDFFQEGATVVVQWALESCSSFAMVLAAASYFMCDYDPKIQKP
ncbi:hypothetical protein P389DRAFT_164369 [Cystobasidium minutum MCA 4210]|uniref:uncharacterized protein n=1 Tax=Cystobasidium minutum MCA 4210 TaxID=1397322 RepID=UPI0034CE4E0D|eukprot:jgi/Rhomi1/164369/fgenesh1_kg.1_\